MGLNGGPVITVWAYVFAGLVPIAMGAACPFLLPRASRALLPRLAAYVERRRRV